MISGRAGLARPNNFLRLYNMSSSNDYMMTVIPDIWKKEMKRDSKKLRLMQGIGMVALSVPRRLDHGRCGTREAESCTNGTQEGLFYAGMVLTAIGRGGISFSLSAFYDEQSNPESKNWFKRARDALFECGNWGDKKVVYLIGTVIAFMWVTKWKVLFGIPAICSVFAAFVFLCGCCCYKYKCPEGIEGSPLTSVFKVLHTAATSKIRSQPLNLRQKPFPDRSPR